MAILRAQLYEFPRMEYAKADELHAQEKFQEAIAALGDDVEDKASALVKRSRWTVDIGTRTEGVGEKEKLFRAALADANKAAEKAPDNFEAWKALAIVKGRLQACVGVAEKVQLGKEVKENIDKALELRPDDCASWTVLGAWHAGVSDLNWIVRKAMQALYLGNFPEASHESAQKCFMKAHEIYPNATNAGVHDVKVFVLQEPKWPAVVRVLLCCEVLTASSS